MFSFEDIHEMFEQMDKKDVPIVGKVFRWTFLLVFDLLGFGAFLWLAQPTIEVIINAIF